MFIAFFLSNICYYEKKTLTLRGIFDFFKERMNKKVQYCIIIFMMSLMSISIYGQGASKHYFRISLDGGYADRLVVVEEDKPIDLIKSNGATGDVSLGYRFRKNHFLFDLGLGLGYAAYTNQLKDTIHIQNHVDKDGETFVGYNLYTSRSSELRNIAVQLPIMFGAQWGIFYFLAGLKFSANIPLSYSEKGLYSLSGDYDRFIDVFENMPTDGFVANEPYENALVIDNYVDIQFCAELGCWFSLTGGEYRGTSNLSVDACLSAFVEYGVDIPMQHSPLAAGLRLAVLFELKKSSVCMCLE